MPPGTHRWYSSAMPMFRLTVLLVSLVTMLPAHQKPGRAGPGVNLGERAEKQGKEAGDLEKPSASDDPLKGGGNSGPVRMSPTGKCGFRVSVHPERLMPGQTGVVKVVMILQADAVMEFPSTLRLKPPANGGLLQFGAMVMQPPQSGNVAEAYRGRLVYDNYALAEIPVTMSTRAPLGSKQTSQLQADFQLHEGASGRFLGDFGQRLSVACDVGFAPDPTVQVVAVPSEPTAQVTQEQQSAEQEARPDAAATAGGSGNAGVAAGGVAAPVEAPPQNKSADPAASTDQGPVLVVDEGLSVTPIYLIAGGALLAIVVLMLAMARRR